MNLFYNLYYNFFFQKGHRVDVDDSIKKHQIKWHKLTLGKNLNKNKYNTKYKIFLIINYLLN